MFTWFAAAAAATCPTVPDIAAEVSSARARFSVRTERLDLDLDGTATPLYRVPRLDGGSTVEGLQWELMFVRAGCAVSLGRYHGSDLPTLGAATHHGLRDLEVIRTTGSDTCAEFGDRCREQATYAFDGQTYVARRPDAL